jgi:hypothetical protein
MNIRAIREQGIHCPVSIDTRKADVASAAIEAGNNNELIIIIIIYLKDIHKLYYISNMIL